MGSSKGNKGRRVGEFNLNIGESHCEPVRKLGFVIDTGEVISEAESKYRQKEPLFKSYEQLNDEISLEWFCSDDLIERYEKWDCKNLEKYKPSKAEIDQAKAMMKASNNLPTNGLLKASKEISNLQKNSLSQKALDALQYSPYLKALENTPAGISKRLIDEQKKRNEMLYPPKRFDILVGGLLARDVRSMSDPKILGRVERDARGIVASDLMKQKAGLIYQKTEIEKLTQAGLVKQQEMKAMQAGAIKPEWIKQLDENRVMLAKISTPEYMQAFKKAEQFNKYLTPEYLQATRNSLNAFNSGLNNRAILSELNQHTSLTDQVLNTGITAQIAQDMLEPHRSLTESLQLRLRSYEPEEKPKETEKQLRKTIKQKDEQLELRNKEIAEFKALLTARKKQEKRIRVHQLHSLIRNVDIALTENELKPSAQAVWNEIEKNHDEYDDEAIIQEVKDNTIYWKSKGGKEQTLLMTSFSPTLSAIRKKHKNN